MILSLLIVKNLTIIWRSVVNAVVWSLILLLGNWSPVLIISSSMLVSVKKLNWIKSISMNLTLFWRNWMVLWFVRFQLLMDSVLPLRQELLILLSKQKSLLLINLTTIFSFASVFRKELLLFLNGALVRTELWWIIQKTISFSLDFVIMILESMLIMR